MGNAYVAKATVTEDGQLRLDGKLPMPPGRVLVRVEALPDSRGTNLHLLDLAGRSGLARTREDIDGQIRTLRRTWDECGTGG